MDKFPFAKRTDWPRQDNAFNQALEDLQSRNIPVIDLTASNPTSCGFKYPQEILTAFNSPENLQYQPDAFGKADARAAVARYYAGQNLHILPRDIILTSSTSEAYSFLMRLLVNPGEKVLIPKPSYPLFQFLLEINDVEFDYYPLSYDGNKWHLDINALARMEDKKTRAIIVVNPNNPTGSYLNRAELNFLNEFCLKHRMSIISDEVFFEYALNTGDMISCAANKAALTFVLGGLSKTLGLPQMKCAWILPSGPQEILQESLERLEIIADTYLSVNTPVQNALEVWLGHAQGIRKQVISRVKDNWQWLQGQLKGHTQALSLQGGWYVTLRIPAIKSEEEWVLEILKEDHVSVYPGYFFDFEKEAYIVLSLISPIASFREGVGRILQRLDKI